MFQQGVIVGVGAAKAFDQVVDDGGFDVTIAAVFKVDVVDDFAKALDGAVGDVEAARQYLEGAEVAVVTELDAEHIEWHFA